MRNLSLRVGTSTFSPLLSVVFLMTFGLASFEAKADVLTEGPRKSSDFTNRRYVALGNQWLKLEFLSNEMIHFEFGSGTSENAERPIKRSPLFADAQFTGAPTFIEETSSRFKTSDLVVEIKGICFEVSARLSNRLIGTYCAGGLQRSWKNLKIETSGLTHVYGLGQTFDEKGDIYANRLGRVTQTAGDYGNFMKSHLGGAVGEVIFPVTYSLGGGEETHLFILDNVYKQTWDLSTSTWNIGMFGDSIAGFVGVYTNPLQARKKLMTLTGKPLLPPKKIFGFWMSEYGYDDWQEIDQRLNSMRSDRFPIDGFFLDLQWFGNVTPGSDFTAMGKLRFDESKFPEPKRNIDRYSRQGIGLIPIEESYVGKALPEYDYFGERGYLAHKCGYPNQPSYLTGQVTGNTSEWWGRGGMIDWSNPDGAAFWHDSKRQKLVDLGLMGHWLDLGEPEMFDATSCYHGAGDSGKKAHQDIHNLFSWLWVKSLYEGYERNLVSQRPYSILRTGNIGMQKFGASLWSGDIGGNLESLSGHIAAHAQLSWSGLDYYSSDIGGFHRNQFDGEPLTEIETKENFTQWFANASWLDVPFRSHVMNLDNNRITAPNRIGHVESNKANLIERYKLVPYYYSLGFNAFKSGDPLMTPLAMAFPSDASARDIVNQRMLGQLMVVSASKQANYEAEVSFPAGRWYDWRTGEFIVSDNLPNRTLSGYPLYRDGLFQLPVFARAGAIIPVQLERDIIAKKGLVSEKNIARDALGLHVFVDDQNGSTSQVSSFELYEDDGVTNAYRTGQYRVTKIEQVTTDLNQTELTIFPSVGPFVSSGFLRQWHITFHAPGSRRVKSVQIENHSILKCHPDQWESGTWTDGSCYFPGKSEFDVEVILSLSDIRQGQKVAVVWEDNQTLQTSTHFSCKDTDTTQRSYGMYVVGSDSKLGEWDVQKAVPLNTNGFLRGVWTGIVPNLPLSQRIEWKCVKIYPHSTGRRVEWQQGDNNIFNSTNYFGFQGVAKGNFWRRFF
ncbi:MAG: DUF5110 domain-containing protein [Proteobacteria bacterium]|nr:DUF5110 domain-containing protein [Pseudomonadota bacterium]